MSKFTIVEPYTYQCWIITCGPLKQIFPSYSGIIQHVGIISKKYCSFDVRSVERLVQSAFSEYPQIVKAELVIELGRWHIYLEKELDVESLSALELLDK